MASIPPEPTAAQPGAALPAAPEGGPAEGDSVEELRAEIARLRAHLAEAHAQPSSARQLLALLDHAPSLIFIKDVNYRYVLVNQRFASYGHAKPDDLVGKTDHGRMPPEVADKLRADEEQVIKSGHALEVEEQMETPVGFKYFLTVKFPIYDAQGGLLGVGGFITDITERKRLEIERLDLKEQVIAAQQAALREQSTPLVPLAEGILAMPIVGTIDSIRAQEIMEALLQGISKQGAHTAILDITGVRMVDAQVAAALVSAARAARLLGTDVVLTGISPEVAQTLVQLGADLSGITTMSTLASGIAHALKGPKREGARRARLPRLSTGS